MRINRASSNIFSNNTFNALKNASKQNNANPFLAQNYQDTFSTSSLAGRLCFEGKAVTSWNDKITKPTDDKALQMLENQMNVIGNILEQQKNLTEFAKDESLSDLDRIDLQIEMEGLQKKLTAETCRMSMMMAGMSSSEIHKELAYFLDSSSDGLLQRARERIQNGEEWDVAETFELELELKEIKVNTESGSFNLKAENSEYQIPPDIDLDKAVVAKVQDVVGGDIVVTKNESLPTLSEKLKLLNGINLMDSKSAANGSEKIDKQIENLTKMKQEFLEFYDEYANTPQVSSNISQNNSDINNLLHVEQSHRTADTVLGTMTFSSTKSNGETDLSDPRLQDPSSKLGSFFSKMEKLFKDEIGRSLGYKDPLSSELIDKLHAFGPAK